MSPVNPKEAPRGYIAKPCAYGCNGCVFVHVNDCRNLKAKCQAFDRKDGRDVIFRKAPKKKTKKST